MALAAVAAALRLAHREDAVFGNEQIVGHDRATAGSAQTADIPVVGDRQLGVRDERDDPFAPAANLLGGAGRTDDRPVPIEAAGVERPASGQQVAAVGGHERAGRRRDQRDARVRLGEHLLLGLVAEAAGQPHPDAVDGADPRCRAAPPRDGGQDLDLGLDGTW